LGKKFLQAARKEFVFSKEVEVVTLVNQVGAEIVEAIGEDPSRYHFFVVKQEQMNAFAIPGGYIFLFEGLLKKLDSIDALAGVLAHEIAHVQQNHHFKDAKKMGAVDLATMAAIIAAALAGEGEAATSVIAPAANIALKLRFSRKNEEEADFFAIKYLQRTRYDPTGLSDFFKTLAFYQRFTGTPILPYLSTHPGVNERRFKVDAQVKNSPVQREVRNFEMWDWGRILTILRAKEGDAVVSFFDRSGQERGRMTEERRHYLLGLSALKSGLLEKAQTEYQAAIRDNPDNPVYYADLAHIYMRRRQAAPAKEAALKSLQLSGDGASPHLVLGMIAQAEERHKKAIEHLEEARSRSPNDPFIHLQLARSFHTISMPVEEHFHLGRYFRLILEPEKALRQFHQVLLMIEEESPLGQKIKGEMEEIKREGI
ncbi:MAG: M48 family metalloprotease, partial [Nitrospiria bacterium]